MSEHEFVKIESNKLFQQSLHALLVELIGVEVVPAAHYEIKGIQASCCASRVTSPDQLPEGIQEFAQVLAKTIREHKIKRLHVVTPLQFHVVSAYPDDGYAMEVFINAIFERSDGTFMQFMPHGGLRSST